MHVDEITELKSSVAEQAALVAELEDAVQSAEARAAASDAGRTQLRRTAKDSAEADRSRRSRLAELEGKLLRFEHERKSAPRRPPSTTSAPPGRANAISCAPRSSSSRSARAARTATTTPPRRSWTRWPPRRQRRAARRPRREPSREHAGQLPAARDPSARRAGRRAPTLRCAVALRDCRLSRGAGRGPVRARKMTVAGSAGPGRAARSCTSRSSAWARSGKRC